MSVSTISLTRLKDHVAAYDDTPRRTLALEHRTGIGSGFHGKWYRSQREHLLGWLVVQEAQARKKGEDPATVDARGMWGRLKCSPLMFWLAESAGVAPDLLDDAELAAVEAALINPTDGDPHGKLMRQVLPWEVVSQAVHSGPDDHEPGSGTIAARQAFDRLTDKVHTYRGLREWAQ
ncbi:hypothetical protein [Flavimaricola marinus]|uniref:Uncharacterized protein n=1 Tax=Flavimaricola marinus TaxID=1819565 RepID=A0A238LKQ6_9RHOB|nr:hypothetical protein [Flavimaricola marinus]SMY10269.1 hypothetical protein LOM8899_04444 [Flavimaricola marinus]